MEVYNNSLNLTLKGNSLNLLSVLFLIFFNLFLIFFPDSGALNLNFFVFFTFLVIIYETNKEDHLLKVGGRSIHLTPAVRNSIFLISSSLLLIAMATYSLVIKYPYSGRLVDNLIGIERVFQLFFALAVMFTFYKLFYLDFGFLIALFVLASLIYALTLKSLLEMVFNVDYLKFIFHTQDIQKEIGNMLNSYNQGLDQPSEMRAFNLKLVNILLGFIGTFNTLINTVYFIILTKVAGVRILKMNVRLSQIYLPSILIWFFFANGIGAWVFFKIFGFNVFLEKSSARIVAETLTSGLLVLMFIFMIQGASVVLAYYQEKSYSGQSIFSPPLLIFLAVGLGVAVLTEGGIPIFFNIIFVTMMMVGITDQWMDYRKRFHSQIT